MLDPLGGSRRHREAIRAAQRQALLVAPELDAHLSAFVGIKHQWNEEENIPEFDCAAARLAQECSRGHLQVACSREQRLKLMARLQYVLGEHPLASLRKFTLIDDLERSIEQALLQQQMRGVAPCGHPHVAPRSPIDHGDGVFAAQCIGIQERIGRRIVHLAGARNDGTDG